MRVKLAVVCSSRLLCERLERLIEGDREIVIVRKMTPPIDPRDVVELRSDVTLIDRETLLTIPRDLLSGRSPRARLLLVEGHGHGAFPGDGDAAELLTKGDVAGIIPAETKGRLLKKAIKMIASGELWLGLS